MGRSVRWSGRLAVLFVVVCTGVLPALAADPISTAQAGERLDALKRRLKRQRSTNAELIAALEAVDAAYQALEPTPTDKAEAARQAAFRKGAEAAFLKAFVLEKIPPRTTRNERHAVQFVAARILGRTRPEVAPKMMLALERKIFADDDYVRRPTFYATAFRALVDLDAKGTLTWLLERAVNADVTPDSMQRALAGIEAILDMPDLSGDQRRRVVRRLIDIFQSYAFHWPNKYDAIAGFRSGTRRLVKVAGTATTYWVDMRPVVLAAMRQLSTDPRTGLPPFDKDGSELESLPRYLNWFQKHPRASSPPWRDRPGPARREQPTRIDGRYVRRPVTELELEFGVPWESWWALNRRVSRRRPETDDPTSANEPARGPSDAEDRDAFRSALREKTLRPLLVEALASPVPEIRAVAAMGLGRLRMTAELEALLPYFEAEGDERFREAVSLGVLLSGDATFAPWLRGRARDDGENPQVRCYAVLALGAQKDAGFLVDLLDDDPGGNPAVRDELRATTVFALGLTGDAAHGERLADLLSDASESPAVRAQAGRGLSRLAAPETVGTLLKVIRRVNPRDEDRVPQSAAALALAHLVEPGDTKVLRAIEKRLKKPKGQFGGTRNLLVLALGRIGGEDAERILMEGYERCLKATNRYAERGWYLLALGLTGRRSAAATLRRQMETLDHEKDLSACAAALAMTDAPSGIPSIRGRWGSSTRDLTRHGAVALGLLGEEASADAIRAVLARRRAPILAAEGALALALMLGADAVPDIQASWDRSRTKPHLEAMARIVPLAAGPEARDWMLSLYRDAARSPYERALALAALLRLADPDTEARLDPFALDFHPYASTSTLTGLARHRDLPFLH